jgi:hypothetical protein
VLNFTAKDEDLTLKPESRVKKQVIRFYEWHPLFFDRDGPSDV